jgi:hypothetical protein
MTVRRLITTKRIDVWQVPQGRHIINRMLQLTDENENESISHLRQVPQGRHIINRMLQLTADSNLRQAATEDGDKNPVRDIHFQFSIFH